MLNKRKVTTANPSKKWLVIIKKTHHIHSGSTFVGIIGSESQFLE